MGGGGGDSVIVLQSVLCGGGILDLFYKSCVWGEILDSSGGGGGGILDLFYKACVCGGRFWTCSTKWGVGGGERDSGLVLQNGGGGGGLDLFYKMGMEGGLELFYKMFYKIK